MAYFTEDMGRALATQVRRVNNDPERLRERIAELEAQVERQRAIIASYRREREPEAPPVGSMYNGRPIITALEAAQWKGVSKATVCRYLQTGHWQGVRVDNTGRWAVFTDQPLPVKSRRKQNPRQ